MTPAQASTVQAHLDATDLPRAARVELAEALGLAPYWGRDIERRTATAHAVLRTPDITEPVEDTPAQSRGSARHRLQVAFSGRRIA